MTEIVKFPWFLWWPLLFVASWVIYNLNQAMMDFVFARRWGYVVALGLIDLGFFILANAFFVATW